MYRHGEQQTEDADCEAVNSESCRDVIILKPDSLPDTSLRLVRMWSRKSTTSSAVHSATTLRYVGFPSSSSITVVAALGRRSRNALRM